MHRERLLDDGALLRRSGIEIAHTANRAAFSLDVA
jgi:hypothetical protein